MYLSAEVPQGGNKVFIQFDRGCISACGCTCKFSGWCSHILALILARIRRANTTALVVHPPLSETFSQFNRDQLQKLLQYLVEGHPLELVPVAQAISSELQDVSSELNNLPGAPGNATLFLTYQFSPRLDKMFGYHPWGITFHAIMLFLHPNMRSRVPTHSLLTSIICSMSLLCL